MKRQLFVSIILLVLAVSTFAQGKATVYVARVGMMGAAINFKYFMGDQYLGKFNSNKYLKLELEPGEYVIWAQSENKSYAVANVEAGKSYILQAIPQMGGMKARVELSPMTESEDKKMMKQLDKIKKLISSKDPESFDAAQLKEEQMEMADKIAEAMEKYENELKGTDEVAQLNEAVELN